MSSKQQLVDEWNQSHAPRLQVQPKDLEWNFDQQNIVSYDIHKFANTLTLTAVAQPSSGLQSNTLWISLWGYVQNAPAFVQALAKHAKGLGKEKLVIGGEEFHFVPGIPESDFALIEAFNENGFSGKMVSDYVGRLPSEAVDHEISNALHSCKQNKWIFLPSANDAQLRDFLAHEFPGRWLREFDYWLENESFRRAFWTTLHDTSGLIGFARLALRNRLDYGWTPAALRLPPTDSGPQPTDSSLGPIGIAKRARVQGAGRALLGLALGELQNQKAEMVCIDWTDAHRYYEPLKFQRAREYHSMWKII